MSDQPMTDERLAQIESAWAHDPECTDLLKECVSEIKRLRDKLDMSDKNYSALERACDASQIVLADLRKQLAAYRRLDAAEAAVKEMEK